MPRFWVFTADHHMYEDAADDIQLMLNRFRQLTDASPLDCQYSLLPDKNVFMIYWTAPARSGTIDRPLNMAATRILVDRFLLDTPTPLKPTQPPAHRQQEMQRAMRCCAYGKVVFFKVNKDEQLVDYTADEIKSDWMRFFVKNHPCADPKNSAFLQTVPYSHLWFTQARFPIVVHMLREPFSGCVSQRQRTETVIIGHNLFMLDPLGWLKLNDFAATVTVHFLIKKNN